MKTIALTTATAPSLPEVLAMAHDEPLLVRTEAGDEYLIGFVDEFQQEIDRMNASSALQALLTEREKEAATIPIEVIQARLGQRPEKSSLP
jgi:hypothetical protein